MNEVDDDEAGADVYAKAELDLEGEPKVEEEALSQNEEDLKPRYTIQDLIEKNPVFKNISPQTKSQLIGYCKLHLKEDE